MRQPIIGDMRQGLTGVEIWDGRAWHRIETQQDRIERKLDRVIELLEAQAVQPEPQKYRSPVEEITALLQDQILRSKTK